MSHPNTERDERVECANCSNPIYYSEGKWYHSFTAGTACNVPAYAMPSTTTMRDRCVAKVRELRGERVKELHVFANDANHADDAEYTRAVLFVLHGVITALESLTLEGEQEK